MSGTTGNPTAPDSPQPAVACVHLREVELTPIELVLTQDIPAGTKLRLRQQRRLRPLLVGIYQVTSVTAQGLDDPLPLSDVPTFADITDRWSTYEFSGSLAVVRTPTDLPAGAKLTVRGRKYDGVDPVRQRYTHRQCGLWMQRDDADAPEAPVTAPLIVRTVSGPVCYLQAWRKPDNRLIVQAFDDADNPADTTGMRYTVTGDAPDAAPLSAPASPGCDITEITLPAALRASRALHAADTAGHACRSSALPRTIDGRAIFFGDIHCHTGFSDGDYPIDDAIAWAHQRIGLDFTGPGDHISQQGDFDGLTVSDYARFGRQYEQPGSFCRIPALETSCADGHQLLLARDFETFVKLMAAYAQRVGPEAGGMDSAACYTALTEIMIDDRTMVSPNHPIGHAGRWPDIPDKTHIRATEIFHGGSSHECSRPDGDWLAPGHPGSDSSIRHALAAGYRLAFLGESDNHRALPGQPMVGFHGITAVQAVQLDTASIFDAICARRCYATSGARIVADATLNDAPIGSEIALAPGQPRTFRIVVCGTAPIVETQIVYCGCVLETFPAPADTCDVCIDWTHPPPPPDMRPAHEYYYIRLRQTDAHAAWLSPFWLTA